MKISSNMLLCLSLSSVFFVVSINSVQAKTPKKHQTVKRFCPPILKKKNIKALISSKSNQGYNPYKTKNVNKGFYLSLNNKSLDIKKLKSLKSAELISINEDAIKMLCRYRGEGQTDTFDLRTNEPDTVKQAMKHLEIGAERNVDAMIEFNDDTLDVLFDIPDRKDATETKAAISTMNRYVGRN